MVLTNHPSPSIHGYVHYVVNPAEKNECNGTTHHTVQATSMTNHFLLIRSSSLIPSSSMDSCQPTHSCICIPTFKPGQHNPSSSVQHVYWQISTYRGAFTRNPTPRSNHQTCGFAVVPLHTMPNEAKPSCPHTLQARFALASTVAFAHLAPSVRLLNSNRSDWITPISSLGSERPLLQPTSCPSSWPNSSSLHSSKGLKGPLFRLVSALSLPRRILTSLSLYWATLCASIDTSFASKLAPEPARTYELSLQTTANSLHETKRSCELGLWPTAFPIHMIWPATGSR
jgi:hypothetical protein